MILLPRLIRICRRPEVKPVRVLQLERPFDLFKSVANETNYTPNGGNFSLHSNVAVKDWNMRKRARTHSHALTVIRHFERLRKLPNRNFKK